MARLTDRPDMTLDVYRGRKTTKPPKNTLARARYVIDNVRVNGVFSYYVLPLR